MDHVSLGVLLWKVEEMDCARSMSHVDDDVANLLEPVCAFIHSKQLRNHRSRLGAYLARRDMRWEWSVGLAILQEGPVEVDEK